MNIRKRTLVILSILCAGLFLSACSHEVKENSSPSVTTIPTGEAEMVITPVPDPGGAIPQSSIPTKPTEAPTDLEATILPTQIPTIVPTQEAKDDIAHSNTVLKEGSFLYYKEGSYKRGDWTSTCKLVAENTETGVKKVLTSFAAEEFYLQEGSIYYTDHSDIYRINTDGSHKTKLYDGNAANASIIRITGDYLYFYFSMEGQIFRININGYSRNRKLLAQNAAEVTLLGDRIYYTVKGINDIADLDSTDRLFSMALDGSDKKEIYESYDLYDLTSNESGIYFIDLPTKDTSEAYLCKLDSSAVTTKLCTLKQEELSKKGAVSFNSHTLQLHCATDTTLYYSVAYRAVPNTELYSIGSNGDNHMLLLNIKDLSDLSPNAYLSTVRIDENHLILTIDCDDDAPQTYLLELSNSHASKLDTTIYLGSSLDILGDEVFVAKAQEPISYGLYGDFIYQRQKLSEFVR